MLVSLPKDTDVASSPVLEDDFKAALNAALRLLSRICNTKARGIAVTAATN